MYVEKPLEASFAPSLACALQRSTAKARDKVRDEDAQVVAISKLAIESGSHWGNSQFQAISTHYIVKEKQGCHHRVRDEMRLEKAGEEPWKVTDSQMEIDHNITRV